MTYIDRERTVTIGQLIEIARGLGPDGDGLATAGPEANPEYARGIAEVLTEAAGISLEFTGEMLRAVSTADAPA